MKETWVYTNTTNGLTKPDTLFVRNPSSCHSKDRNL
jgi:hypothetical protein